MVVKPIGRDALRFAWCPSNAIELSKKTGSFCKLDSPRLNKKIHLRSSNLCVRCYFEVAKNEKDTLLDIQLQHFG